MSHLFRVDFLFENVPEPSRVMAALMGADWGVAFEDEVVYMIEGAGGFDWHGAVAPDAAAVFGRIDEAAMLGQHVAVAVRWQHGSGGDVLFVPGGRRITFTGSLDRLTISQALPFTDVGWYVARLLPPLLPFGLIELGVLDRA